MMGFLHTDHHASNEIKPQSAQPPSSLAATLKKSCMDNTQALIILGGYITFTNAFRIFLDFMPFSHNSKNVLSSFLEIIGGVQAIYTTTLYSCTEGFLDDDSTLLWRRILHSTDEQFSGKISTLAGVLSET